MPRRLVCLYDLSQFALILEQPTGVVYYNQVAGNACAREEAEGVLVPLDLGDGIMSQIEERLAGSMRISEDDADFLDGVFAANAYLVGVRVDRARIRDSSEAWVHVSIEASPAYREPWSGRPQLQLFFGFDAGRGVLTWCNSD